MTELDIIRGRLEARFGPGWPTCLEVPDAWLTRLANLDAQLARLDPDYRLAQVKTKFGGLRYYLQDAHPLPCCAAWNEAHPLPEEAASETALNLWESAAAGHAASTEHITADAERETRETRKAALIDAAEAASYTW